MFYHKNSAPQLAPELFANPTAEYRGTPFWAWNKPLDEAQLRRQIGQMQGMGMGGFHMHSRAGMGTPYLSDEFMAMTKACVDEARQRGMLAWLYDEDRWPSGAAGGMVTCDHSLRQRWLAVTPGAGQGEGVLARYAIRLDDEGCLAGYAMVGEDYIAAPGEALWHARLEISPDSPWYNNQGYLDTLNPKAAERFIQVTHERYKQVLGEDFGGVIPAIFSDEPNFGGVTGLGRPTAQRTVRLPYTDDFPASYRAVFGEDFLAKLPEIVWQLPGNQGSVVRWRYFEHLSERFAAGFADVVGAWCEQNNLMMTGHVLLEGALGEQTHAVGEAMRAYRAMQLPGIDMLLDDREYATAKQAASVAHQDGRPGVLSEMYGVTNWTFDFRKHKLHGDWQAAMGVTVRVHHLAWLSMAGEGKRDYPASINYQSPWHEEYSLVEDHFARLNTALTRGVPHVKVGVIHPIESFWLAYGPLAQTGAAQKVQEANFQNLLQWMAFGLVDFDYIAESLLPDQCAAGGAPLQVGKMAYDAVVVPAMDTIRATTLDRLETFAQAGGDLIFCGAPPSRVDGLPSDRAQKLAEKAKNIGMDPVQLMEAIQPHREVDLLWAYSGERADGYIHQMRCDGDDRWLFIANGKYAFHRDMSVGHDWHIVLRGAYIPTLYDTQTGDIRPLPATYTATHTIIPARLYQHDSLLLHLTPGRAGEAAMAEAPEMETLPGLRGTVEYTLSEPNVYLLDTAESRFDDEVQWRPEDEILRIDNTLREALGIPPRRAEWPQPWLVPPTPPQHMLHLRFAIHSDIAVPTPQLAIEDVANLNIRLNGAVVDTTAVGYFVDTDIPTIALPALPAGDSVLEVDIPFGERTAVEWCYLLGDFGVQVQGTQKTIIQRPARLGFGDWTRQGLPFYAGNVTYHMPIQGDGRNMSVAVTHFRVPVVKVGLDGQDVGVVAYAPYRVDLGPVTGEHRLDITAYGNRANTFGALHNADEKEGWFGPDVWRRTGDAWCDEYHLWVTGVLVAPKVMVQKTKD